MTREQKILILQELISGNSFPLQALKANMPAFITYHVKGGMYYLDWENKIFPESEFLALKQGCTNIVFWHQEKTY